MYRPLNGDAVSYKDYIREGNTRLHCIGLLGGVIWCLGMSLNILASEQAGYAISYGLGQGATMIAAIWGVFIWKEFDGASLKIHQLIKWMFISFVLGLILIIFSRFQ